MMNIPDFTGWAPEAIVSYCQRALGVRKRTPEEWDAYYRDLERKEKEEQERLKELYEKGGYVICKRCAPSVVQCSTHGMNARFTMIITSVQGISTAKMQKPAIE